MQSLYEFLRRHPTGVDAFWALCLAVPTLIIWSESRSGLWEYLSAVVVTLALGTVLTLRQRFPRPMLLLAIATGFGQLALDVEINPLNFAMLVIIYTNALLNVRWASRLGLVMAFLAPVIAGVRWPAGEGDASGVQVVFGTVLLTATVVMAWVLGDSLRTRRAYYAQLEERAARLEREREAQAKVAVAAERARIARELHDVVAHNVSVMVVQADGAAYVLDTAPDQARNALETIAGTGRQALAEMRRLLGVLRTGDSPESGEYMPQPGVEQLAELVEQVRGTGLDVDFRIEGTPRPLPSGVELTAYRIVQEALTNTRKHAGPGAGASVRLIYTDQELVLLAEDDGGCAPRQWCRDGGRDGPGHGLIGMRERVGMVGGQLDTGPGPDGGFRINAVLPLRSA